MISHSSEQVHSLVFGAADFYAYSTDTGGGPSTFVAINKQ